MVQKDAFEALEHKIMALRENSRTGDERKTMDEVFDRDTLLGIYKLMTDGYLDTIQYPVSTGKEGNVFAVADDEGKLFALKIYRTSNASFNRIAKYIEGDKRFRGIAGSRRKVIFAWANKEFRNLQRLVDAGVRVPSPIRYQRNMLMMEYIGNKRGPAPLLRNVVLDDPGKVYETIVKYMRLAYQEAGLVHADLSEYNILYYRKRPVIIDVGQAVLVDHVNSKDFLLRDIENINRYFRGLEVDVMDRDELLLAITEASR
ncbi:MAG: serine protein kinase RIO [Methanomassiliicoccus sp.]|nr:serine protein kinase RIO [Methanomassiliicoccus sp.]